MSLRRTLVTGGIATTTLAATLGIGYAMGRQDDPTPPVRDDRIALANADLTAAASCEDLLASYVERGLERVGPYGWDTGVGYVEDGGILRELGGDDEMAMEGDAAGSSAASPEAAAPSTSRSTSNETGTNVQEAGVDEADSVKVAGTLLVRLQGDLLRVYDVSGVEPVEVSSLPVDGIGYGRPDGGELLVVDGRVVVLGRDDEDRQTTVSTVDLADPASPTLVEETVVAGQLDAARLHGDVVRLVVRTPLPELDFADPGSDGERSARDHNREQVAESTLADWLPTVDGEPVVDCEDVAIPEADAALGSVSVIAFDPASPEDWTSTAVATDAATSYFSADRFYLASAPSDRWIQDCWVSCDLWSDATFESDGTTSLYAFELEGTGTTYVASGEVEGTIEDRWSMDAVAGSLRVAVGPSAETGSFSSVVTFREEGDALVEEGRVDGLGVDEDIKSVRWFDDLAIIVTFRQVDPLYAVDLTDPADPDLMGELKIPGFSEYLHPLGERRLVGIGQDADLSGMTLGAQAALYDVTDLTSPRQIDVVRYPRGSVAGVATDPRQLTWLPESRTVLTVISSSSQEVFVSVLTLDEGEMGNRLLPVEYGSDAALVRLVPLASGKVVLVTGEDVSFLDL